MNFRSGSDDDEPEINLIPLIDVLVLTLIFLLVTTSFSKEAQLNVRLPQAVSEDKPDPTAVRVTVDANGQLYINNTQLLNVAPETLRQALAAAAGSNKEPLVVIHADGKAPHEAVVRVMDAARRLGFFAAVVRHPAAGRGAVSLSADSQRDWRLYRRLFEYAWPHKGVFMLSVLGAIMLSATAAGFAALMKAADG